MLGRVGVSHRYFKIFLPKIGLHLGSVIRLLLKVQMSAKALVCSVGRLCNAKLVLGVGRPQDQTHRILEGLDSANRVLLLHDLAFKNLMQEVALENILMNLLQGGVQHV